MRILLLMLWLLVPVGALAYHFGPGQAHLQMDSVAAILKSARADVAEQRWGAAQAAFEQALAQTPETETRLRRNCGWKSASPKCSTANCLQLMIRSWG
jgi:hypothetical protein